MLPPVLKLCLGVAIPEPPSLALRGCGGCSHGSLLQEASCWVSPLGQKLQVTLHPQRAAASAPQGVWGPLSSPVIPTFPSACLCTSGPQPAWRRLPPPRSLWSVCRACPFCLCVCVSCVSIQEVPAGHCFHETFLDLQLKESATSELLGLCCPTALGPACLPLSSCGFAYYFFVPPPRSQAEASRLFLLWTFRTWHHLCLAHGWPYFL